MLATDKTAGGATERGTKRQRLELICIFRAATIDRAKAAASNPLRIRHAATRDQIVFLPVLCRFDEFYVAQCDRLPICRVPREPADKGLRQIGNLHPEGVK